MTPNKYANLDTDDYIDFVAWQNIDRYNPPIMNNYWESQIRAFIDNTDVIQLPHFHCLTQGAEKCIKCQHLLLCMDKNSENDLFEQESNQERL